MGENGESRLTAKQDGSQDPAKIQEQHTAPGRHSGEPLPDKLLEKFADHAVDPALGQEHVRWIERAEELPEGLPDSWKQYLPTTLHAWQHDGRTEQQLRIPEDKRTDDGRKYLFRKGAGEDDRVPLNKVRDDGRGPVLFVEGSWQHLAVASNTPAEFAVYGMHGCWGWKGKDLSFLAGREFYVMFDADRSKNSDVWDAAKGLVETATSLGVVSAKLVNLPGVGKEGADDFLARIKNVLLRREAMARLIKNANEKLGRRPAAKRKKKADTSKWFGDDGGLLVYDVAKAMQAECPMALTREGTIAIYLNGAYRIDPAVFAGMLGQMLKNDYQPRHRANVEEMLIGTFGMSKHVLPDRMSEPLLNVPNGMVDLRTGEVLPHDPGWMSVIQFAVEYDPAATCPTFDRWAEETIGDQLDDLEETASQMLDPSRTPDKALLLFGPARSGKSTYLRLLEKIVGIDNVSNVSMHELSEDQFAAAQVYGKALNSSAELSARHVEDISKFKMMTGEDRIRGNRKYGKDFFFRSQALFAFSTNEIPTVGESSRAYSERIKPFRFGTSFADRIDYGIEPAMAQELPGILARLVRAWQRRYARGHDLPSNPDVRNEFERASDRVQMWLEQEMEVILEVDGKPVTEGSTLPTHLSLTPTALTELFSKWAAENHMAGMGRTKLMQRLKSREAIVEVRQERTKARALNLIKATEGSGGSSGPSGGSSGQKLPPANSQVNGHVGAESGRSGSSEHITNQLSAFYENEECSRRDSYGQELPQLPPDPPKQPLTSENGGGSSGSGTATGGEKLPPAAAGYAIFDVIDGEAGS
jgi:putative DNA primase/helicase